MDVGVIHQLVSDINFETYKVDITIQFSPSILNHTVGIWMTPTTPQYPASFAQGPKRADPLKILAIKAADCQVVTRGTTILAPDGPGGPQSTFRVDGESESFTDHKRFKVIRDDSGVS